MDNKSVFYFLGKYLIKDLVDVENILDGQQIFILKDGNHTITIEKDKVNLREVDLDEIREKYFQYAYRYYEYNESFLQKINYEDFLKLETDYNERIEGYLWKLESKIISSIQKTIEHHLEKGIDVREFLNCIISKIEENCKILQSQFTSEGDFKIKLYNSFNTEPKITNTFKMVLSTHESFVDILKDDFSKSNLDFEKQVIDLNPFPRIFIDRKGYEFFLKLKEGIGKRNMYELANYSFIFRKMLEDKFIYKIQESEFRDFLNDNFEIDLNKLKTFDTYNGSNLSIYNYLKP
jgi:hypothetical protein